MLQKLREFNIRRQKIWDPESKLGLLYKSNEMGGEVGEAQNKIKKMARELLGLPGSRTSLEEIADELADVVITADLVAAELGIDLEAAIPLKFNKTSKKNGLDVYMHLD